MGKVKIKFDENHWSGKSGELEVDEESVKCFVEIEGSTYADFKIISYLEEPKAELTKEQCDELASTQGELNVSEI